MRNLNGKFHQVNRRWITLGLMLGFSAALAFGLLMALTPSPTHPSKTAPPRQGSLPDRSLGVPVFSGKAFDTCATPGLSAIRAWSKSGYGAVGVYYAGRGRGCLSQKNLNRKWVTEVSNGGWKILPIFVGSQAPCVTLWHKRDTVIDPDDPAMAAGEATEAVTAAQKLGISPGSPIYLDMESWNSNDKACSKATVDFVRAWSLEVSRRGYLPGFYSSAGSGVKALSAARLYDLSGIPDVIWFARWGVRPSLTGEPTLRGGESWPVNRRIHQYAGDVAEEHGGVPMRINTSLINAPVALVRRTTAG
ncbi:DUF1906 domain-containing protein [Streptomyces sp. NPDC005533]|uniref:DUF1906 domain-containing protein n=1 Tax=Streptomyces sp. NPDC005533 TaxID=3364723 RepID=UPI0036C023F5